MSIKLFSVSTTKMAATLGIRPSEHDALDLKLKDNGFIRLDCGYQPGNIIRYIRRPEEWTDEKITEALPTIALVRMAITVAQGSEPINEKIARAIVSRFNPQTEESRGLIEVQLAYSLQDGKDDYAQPVRESFNFTENSLTSFALWCLGLHGQTTYQMLRRAADISGLPYQGLKSSLPPGSDIGEKLNEEANAAWNDGLTATTAELATWLYLNPLIDSSRYSSYANSLDLDPMEAWQQVDDWRHKKDIARKENAED